MQQEKKRYTAEEVLNLQSAAYQKGYNEGYQLRKLEHPSTPIWVKSTDRLPGWNLHVHWRIGNGPQTKWKTPVSGMIQSNYITNWEWLDEETGQSNKDDAGAFAEWLYKNRWFHFENGRWEYTFEQGSSVSRGEYLKKYIKTTEQLYEQFKNRNNG